MARMSSGDEKKRSPGRFSVFNGRQAPMSAEACSLRYCLYSPSSTRAYSVRVRPDEGMKFLFASSLSRISFAVSRSACLPSACRPASISVRPLTRTCDAVGKLQHAPANCGRVGLVPSGHSAYFFKKRHAYPPGFITACTCSSTHRLPFPSHRGNTSF